MRISSLPAAVMPERLGTLKLSASNREEKLNVPDNLVLEKPRSWTIAIETLESANNATRNALKAADSKNLSFDERLAFLKEQGEKWVSDIRENDSEMFIQWLKFNKENIQNGHADLAHLSSDFTMEDYYSFVRKPFSVIA